MAKEQIGFSDLTWWVKIPILIWWGYLGLFITALIVVLLLEMV